MFVGLGASDCFGSPGCRGSGVEVKANVTILAPTPPWQRCPRERAVPEVVAKVAGTKNCNRSVEGT